MAKKKADAPAAEPQAAPKPAAPGPAFAPGEPAPGTTPTDVPATRSFRRTMVGTVTSNKMDKTVTVEVIRNALDPVYKKYIRRRERYKAHDATNQYKVGDKVEIAEHRPISRNKRWLVTKLVARRVEE
jgi:small subunit ribosomal protein S17